MSDTEQYLWSRRSFMKNAFVGTVASLVIGIDDAPKAQSQSSSLTNLSLSGVSQLVHSKKVSPVELTKDCLSRIERVYPKLNAFNTVTGDSALVEARQAEAEIQRDNWRGPLHGIPIALKDLVDTAGVRTTAASGLFKDRIPTQDAES